MPRAAWAETRRTPRLSVLQWLASPPTIGTAATLARLLVAELGPHVRTRHSGMAGCRSTRRVSKIAPTTGRLRPALVDDGQRLGPLLVTGTAASRDRPDAGCGDR